jgi:hypothetical protein
MAMAFSSMRRMPDCSMLRILEAANRFILFLHSLIIDELVKSQIP